ncbi:PspC domain-containing protein [Nocardia brasiliensis]|uniref:PspC domain-containing protein n=2 Tax=Nocardia brasiliensis TaxID=37326 RepID=A0A6G9XLM7_NOCBR|nr:PspC domain-containing protein [Nocardia brasiliensis]QIS01789.1 PspC domain-containing protein [Nocardia brasiliensis]
MGTMTKTSFGDQLQHMWRTRPVRLPRQGPIAGVAAGFGRRYNVDPVLVRVAFVVSAIFGGSGVVLYLLAWLLCSEEGEQASAAESLVGKGHSSQSQTKTIVLIVALAIAVSTMGPVGVGLGGSGLISLALMLAGWWLLHLRNPTAPPGTTSEFSGLMTEGGITATGYPGAAFPPGAPRTAGAAYMPPTSVYTPYTKLPDAYVPEPPAAETTPPHRDSATAAGSPNVESHSVEAPGAESPGAAPHPAEQPTTIIGLEKTETPGEDGTVVLRKPVEPAEEIQDAEIVPDHTPALHKDAPARPVDTGSPTGASRSAMLDRPTPPAWDPLGVAPLAWDLPEPTPVRTVVAPPPKRPRSRLTPVVIGLAILAAAGAGALAASGVEWMTPGRIAAVALAVVGLGLVLGAFLRRGYGLLVLTAPLAGFVLLASAIGPVEFDGTAMGDHLWTPASVDQLDAKYRINMGAGTLDLRQLNLTANRTVEINVRMGDFQVLVPNGMTVRTSCDVAMGECVNGITGPNTPDTPVLDLKADVRAGSMAVHRG